MTWRDDATLAAMALIHAASACAMRALDDRINTIAVSDAMTGTDATARAIIRPEMRAEVGAAADDWFNARARALRQIDARLEPVALRFATMGERPTLPQNESAIATGWSTPAWLRGSAVAIGSAIERAANEVASRAVPDVVRERAEQVSARIAHEIGERSGAHDRLRVAARGELSRTWLGPVPADATPRPYLTDLLDIVDRTARQAMETIA